MLILSLAVGLGAWLSPHPIGESMQSHVAFGKFRPGLVAVEAVSRGTVELPIIARCGNSTFDAMLPMRLRA